MITKEKILSCIQEYLNSKGLFLVEIEISKDNDIEIAIESYKDIVKIDNCIDIDRIVNENFNRDLEDYALTVGSAGLDQPFKVIEQYRKYIGKEVEIVTKKSQVGSKDTSALLPDNKYLSGGRIKGILSAAGDKGIELKVSEKVKLEGSKKKVEQTNTVEFTFQQIKSCKLVIVFK